MLEQSIKWLVRIVGVILFVVLLTTLFTSVLIRYFNIFRGTMAWVEESSRFLFIWVSFLGAVIAMENREHIRIDTLIRFLPFRLLPWYEAIIDVMMLAYLLVMIWFGAELALSSPYASSALQLPLLWVYLALPISGALMAFHVILFRVRRLRGIEPTRPSGPPKEGAL